MQESKSEQLKAGAAIFEKASVDIRKRECIKGVKVRCAGLISCERWQPTYVLVSLMPVTSCNCRGVLAIDHGHCVHRA
jgi:hypothetical protein